VTRLALRDLRKRRTEAGLLALALTAATSTLTVGLVLHGLANEPYAHTRNATLGPDVTAQADAPGLGGGRADLAALRQLADGRAVAARSGPYPLTQVTIHARGRQAAAVLEGRDAAPASVDRPRVTDGHWALRRGVVVERAFADALGIRVDDTLRVGQRNERVTGIAVTAAMPPYPLNGMTAGGPAVRTGLIWANRKVVHALDRSPSYIINLRLRHPASAPAFVDSAIRRLTPNGVPSRTDPPPPFIQSADDLAFESGKLIRNEQRALLVGSWLLALMALASIAVLVGGRMAEQVRRVGLLKAAGASPALVASVLLAEYASVTAVATAMGVGIGRLVAPLLAKPSAGLVGGPAALPFTAMTVVTVTIVTLGIAVVATFVPALRASRTSTVDALLATARNPRRARWVTALSARLPVPLLLGIRMSARRPRRALLSATSAAIAVTGIVTALAANAQLKGSGNGGVPDPRAQRLGEVLLLITILIVAEAAVTTIFTTTATVLDVKNIGAVTRALGATARQVAAAVAAAQTLPALVGALVGVPVGVALFGALSDDASAQVPAWQLGGVVAATVLVTAMLASLPSHASVRESVAHSLSR
jgi:putative ABC transport system permease protein